jgi:hypothetical protein
LILIGSFDTALRLAFLPAGRVSTQESDTIQIVVFTCYLDESGTDQNDSQVAVLGGLLLKMSQSYWLGDELRKCLSKHNIPWPLHMYEFGRHGKLRDVRSEGRRALFSDLVRVINDNKTYSVASTLSSEKYKQAFNGLTDLSMYAASFTQVAMMNGVGSRYGGSKEPIRYLLDDDNRYKPQVVEGHAVLLASEEQHPLNIGSLEFDSDDNVAALQAADVVAWAVRRKIASALKSGFEPLEGLFDVKHIDVEYNEEWMTGVANTIRAKAANG